MITPNRSLEIKIIAWFHSAFGPYVRCTCTKTFKASLDLYSHEKRVHITVL